jgi:hypothetical protein
MTHACSGKFSNVRRTDQSNVCGWGLVTAFFGLLPCTPTLQATFRNVLTMTAQSADMSKLEFKYDYAGLDCLDVIEDFIRLKNPDGARSAVDWKDKSATS